MLLVSLRNRNKSHRESQTSRIQTTRPAQQTSHDKDASEERRLTNLGYDTLHALPNPRQGEKGDGHA